MARAELAGAKTQDITFVVHGAKIRCPFGSREGYLIVPESHGVMLKSKAQLHKKDRRVRVNINSMGICSAPGAVSASGGQEVRSVGRIIVDTVFNRNSNQSTPVGTQDTCICEPQIFMDWQNTMPEVLIDGEEALLNISTIQCMRDSAAIITIVDDGQK